MRQSRRIELRLESSSLENISSKSFLMRFDSDPLKLETSFCCTSKPILWSSLCNRDKENETSNYRRMYVDMYIESKHKTYAKPLVRIVFFEFVQHEREFVV